MACKLWFLFFSGELGDLFKWNFICPCITTSLYFLVTFINNTKEAWLPINYGRIECVHTSRIDISYAQFFFYESAEKVLSYARLNCAVLITFYMSLGQVRHTMNLYPRDFMYSNLVISPEEYFLDWLMAILSSFLAVTAWSVLLIFKYVVACTFCRTSMNTNIDGCAE